MKEFMLLIRNEKDHQDTWSNEKHHQFLKACEQYISELNAEGKLKIAQPLIREGKMVSGGKDAWQENHFTDNREVIVGYYHVLANDLNDAIAIAKRNPEFEYSKTARVEVRPIKTKEVTTGYTYPENKTT